jgi:hypothetical protein
MGPVELKNDFKNRNFFWRNLAVFERQDLPLLDAQHIV